MRRRKDALIGYLFISAGFGLFSLFFIYPVVRSIEISFQKWQVLGEANFIGLENYRFIFKSNFFLRSLFNTILFAAIVTPSSILIALLLAIVMNQKLRGMYLFRTIYFIPVISTMVAVAMIWMWLYRYEDGLINYLLSFIGVQGPAWLRSQTWALPAISIVLIWKGLGLKIMIYLAGLQGIDQSFYDAGRLDGASKWQLFRYITLPLLSPTTFFLAVVTVINVFRVFDIIYVTTQGGPVNATSIVSYFIYLYGFTYFRLGPASAAACFTFLLVLALTLVQFKVSRMWVHY